MADKMTPADTPPPGATPSYGGSRPATREELDNLRDEVREDIRAQNKTITFLIMTLLISVVGGALLGTILSILR